MAKIYKSKFELPLDTSSIDILKKKANTDKGIIREVLVSSGIQLYTIHSYDNGSI